MSNLIAKEYKCFENIKNIREDGTEFWYARDLSLALDYNKWENFHKVIKRAMIACENSGRDILECFPEVRKTSPMPNGGTKNIIDYELTRYACYLIVQNGDPRKEVNKKQETCHFTDRFLVFNLHIKMFNFFFKRSR